MARQIEAVQRWVLLQLLPAPGCSVMLHVNNRSIVVERSHYLVAGRAQYKIALLLLQLSDASLAEVLVMARQ